MNRHNTDNAGARLWTDFDWAGGTTSLGGDYAFNHIYSTNLGENSPCRTAITRMPRPAIRATSGCVTPSSGGASMRPLRPASA